jgi:hypothetical protein
MSYQQAEAVLLAQIGTVGLGNLRRETNPEDRWKARDMRVKQRQQAS